MTLPSQSQFDSALTKTDLAEIFKCRKIRTTGALLRIRPSLEAAAARQPDRMGQRHSLRPVRPRSRPGPLATGPYVVFLQQSGRYPSWASSINRRHGVSLPFCIAALPRWTIRVASGRPSRVPIWASSGSTGDRRLPRHRPHRGRRFACARGEGRKP